MPKAFKRSTIRSEPYRAGIEPPLFVLVLAKPVRPWTRAGSLFEESVFDQHRLLVALFVGPAGNPRAVRINPIIVFFRAGPDARHDQGRGAAVRELIVATFG